VRGRGRGAHGGPRPTRRCPPGAQYGEFRCGYAKDDTDTRLVFYGIRYVVENYISKPWSMEDVKRASIFYS
jgi:hypothetical protein